MLSADYHTIFDPIQNKAIETGIDFLIADIERKKLFLCFDKRFLIKKEKISKGSLDSIPSPSVKIQTMGRKFACCVKAKHYLALSTNL